MRVNPHEMGTSEAGIISVSTVIRVVLLVALSIAFASQASADIPHKINYQGMLVDGATGRPLVGSHNLTFSIYDSVEGGSLLWTESKTEEADSNGVFSTLLGSVTPVDVAFNGAFWLEITVDGETLLPRRELASVPYAYSSINTYHAFTADSALSAGELDGKHADDFATSSVDGYSLDASDGNPADAVYVDQDGKVGVGTTSPAADIHLRGANPTLLIEGTADDSEIQLKTTGDATAQVWTIYKDSATDDLRLNQHGDKVTIANVSGNVGVGTITPTEAKLQVEGKSGDAIYARSDSGSTAIFAVGGSPVGSEMNAAIVATSTTSNAISAYSTWGAAVTGQASRSEAAAIYGYHTGNGPAVKGVASGNYPCIEGFRMDDGVAVQGITNGGTCIMGYTGYDGFPVVGLHTIDSMDDLGPYWKPAGFFAGRNGVVGFTKTGGGIAIVGRAEATNAWAGRFSSTANGVDITSAVGKTGLSVSGGTKSAIVATADGARSLYCEEASEVWFSDYGFGKLDGGVAVVPIDPVFAQTVNLSEPYHVFLQAYGEADLYVSARSAEHFEVRLWDGGRDGAPAGDPNVEFSYRLVAKRAGYEKDRLARAPWADNDANLYPGKSQRQQGE